MTGSSFDIHFHMVRSGVKLERHLQGGASFVQEVRAGRAVILQSIECAIIGMDAKYERVYRYHDTKRSEIYLLLSVRHFSSEALQI